MGSVYLELIHTCWLENDLLGPGYDQSMHLELIHICWLENDLLVPGSY